MKVRWVLSGPAYSSTRGTRTASPMLVATASISGRSAAAARRTASAACIGVGEPAHSLAIVERGGTGRAPALCPRHIPG